MPDQPSMRDEPSTQRGATVTRRAIFRVAAPLAPGILLAGGRDDSSLLPRRPSDRRRMVRFPEKRELVLQIDSLIPSRVGQTILRARRDHD